MEIERPLTFFQVLNFTLNLIIEDCVKQFPRNISKQNKMY